MRAFVQLLWTFVGAARVVCNGRVSVHLSVPSIDAAGGFAAERPAGMIYRSPAAGAVQ